MIPYTSFFETTLLLCLALPTQFESEYAIKAEIINTIVKTAEDHKNVSNALCNLNLLNSIGRVEKHERYLESDRQNKGICAKRSCIWK